MASPIYKWATLALALLLLAFQLYHVAYAPLWVDDTFFAVVAKSIALGNGYNAVLYDKSYPFHFGITAGPMIILPAAGLVWLFGNLHWVPGLTEILLIWLMLVSICIVSRSVLGNRTWEFYFISLVLALLMTAGNANNFSIEGGNHFALWFLMLGEIPASLLVVLAAFVLFSDKLSYQRIFAGSLLLGLAILTKTITALAAAACLGMIMLRALHTITGRRTQVMMVITGGITIAIPFIVFEFCKVLSMGLEPYLALQAETIEYYKHAALIITNRENHNQTVGHNVPLQFACLMSLIGVFTSLSLIPLLFSVLKAARKSYSSPMVFTGTTLIACFLLQFIWWVRFSQPGYERYIVTGLVYLSAGLALMYIHFREANLKKTFILLFGIAMLLENSGNIRIFIYDGFASDPQLSAQLDTASKLHDYEKSGTVLFSCSADYRMEFLLPGMQHLRECSELPEYDFKQSAVLYMYYAQPGKTYRQSAHGRYYMGIEPFPPEVLAVCQNEIMKDGRIALRMCNGKGKL